MHSKPSSLQEAVKTEAKAWARLWKFGSYYCTEKIVPPLNQYPGPITPHMIRVACLSFPMQTGLGPDALQPRSILRLSDNGIEALARILIAIERTGG